MIELVKQDYTDKCTQGGFVRENTKLKSKLLFGMLMILTIALVIVYSSSQNSMNQNLQFWKSAYALIMLIGLEWLFYTFINFKLVINKIPSVQIKWNRLMGPSESTYFEQCAQTHMETHFMEGVDIRKDKIDLYLSYLDDMQLKHKYDGYFEKGLFAAMGLTVWGAYVTKMMDPLKTENVFLATLFLCGVGLMVALLVIFLRSTFGSLYTEVRNLKSYTYSQYRSAILNFYASKL